MYNLRARVPRAPRADYVEYGSKRSKRVKSHCKTKTTTESLSRPKRKIRACVDAVPPQPAPEAKVTQIDYIEPPHKKSGNGKSHWKAKTAAEKSVEPKRKIRAVVGSKPTQPTLERHKHLRSGTFEKFMASIKDNIDVRGANGDLMQNVVWRRFVNRLEWNVMVYSKWFEPHEHCLQLCHEEIAVYELYVTPSKMVVDYFCKMFPLAHAEAKLNKSAIPSRDYSIQKIKINGVKTIPDCAFTTSDSEKFESPSVILEVGCAEPEISLIDKAEVWLKTESVGIVILFKLFKPLVPLKTYKREIFIASVWVRYDSKDPFLNEIKITLPKDKVPADGDPIQIQRISCTFEDIERALTPPESSRRAKKDNGNLTSQVPPFLLSLPKSAIYSPSPSFKSALHKAGYDPNKLKPKWKGCIDIPIGMPFLHRVFESFDN